MHFMQDEKALRLVMRAAPFDVLWINPACYSRSHTRMAFRPRLLHA